MDEHSSVRFAVTADLAEIAAIQAECEAASQWAVEDYLRYDCRVAVCGSRVAGFLVTRQVAAGECEILNIGVAVEFRRRGVASALVREALRQSPGLCFLEVRESNHAARRLYESLGFKPAGIRRNYYTGPDEAAIVMRIFS
jgi:[ribosomal protein S18]-alanine N-acetyltransferase